MTPPMTPVLSVKPKSPRRSLLSRIPFPEVARDSPAKKIDPAMIPLPGPDDIENMALNMPTGSEDLIVHDSESDDDALSPCSGPEDGTAQFDLGRFMFAAST